MLPPDGQTFEKRHLLPDFKLFSDLLFIIFKQGASRGAASGGSDS